MPPEVFPQQEGQMEKEKTTKTLVLVAIACAVVLFGLLIFVLPESEKVVPTPPVGAGPQATTTVKVEKSSTKVPAPEAFTGDTSMADRKETLLDLARKSKTTKLTKEERAYILQEFGGERTALYKFTNDELELIVSALNR